MRVLAAILGLAWLVVVGPPAHGAHCDEDGVAGDSFVSVGIVCEHRESAPSSPALLDRYPDGAEFRYVPFCDRGAGRPDDALYGCGAPLTCGPNNEGILHRELLYVPGLGERRVGTVCLTELVDGALPAITAAIAMRAFERIPLPEPSLSVQPPGGKTLVGLHTILSTEAERFTETVTLLGRRVELDIEPRQFEWSHGDGSSQSTTEPGQPYREGLPMSAYVTHRYGGLGTFDLAVDVVWGARFRVDGGPWQDVGGTITMSSAPNALEVVEAQPNLVGGRR